MTEYEQLKTSLERLNKPHEIHRGSCWRHTATFKPADDVSIRINGEEAYCYFLFDGSGTLVDALVVS